EQPGFTGGVDHAGAPLVTVATQNTGLNAWTGQPLSPKESTASIGSVSDPTGDAHLLRGSNLKRLDVTKAAISRTGTTLHIALTFAGGSLGDDAVAAGGGWAQAFVRWQQGNTLYYAGVEQGATEHGLTFYA